MAIINEQGRKFISQIQLPGVEGTYYVKDSGARQMISEMTGVVFHRVNVVTASTVDNETVYTSSDTPIGVTWTIVAADYTTYGITGETATSVVVTGTLAPSAAQKSYVYLVPSKHIMTSGNQAKDIYDEYVAVEIGTDSWMWEKIGDTDLNIDTLGNLAYDDAVNFSKGSGDNVLGESTTFTNSSSSVSFTGGTSDTFVKSYPGTTSKLETASITGVSGEITFNAVSEDPGTTTVSNITWGTDTTASKIETETKTATNTIFGTDTTASKATAGTAVTLAKPASSATNISYIGDAGTSSVVTSIAYTESTELLTFYTASVSQSSVKGIDVSSNYSLTPYTFADVTVPVVTSNQSESIASVKTNSDVTVPVVTTKGTASVSSPITLSSKTAATKASSAMTVATGSLKADDTSGATVMTGLGTATTASAVTGIGSGTAAAQTITVGTNDTIKIAKYDDLSVSTTAHNA